MSQVRRRDMRRSHVPSKYLSACVAVASLTFAIMAVGVETFAATQIPQRRGLELLRVIFVMSIAASVLIILSDFVANKQVVEVLIYLALTILITCLLWIVVVVYLFFP